MSAHSEETRYEAVLGREALHLWKQDGDPVLAELGSAALNDAVTAASGQVETLELGHRYGHLSPLVSVA
jgi:hypothetical protein